MANHVMNHASLIISSLMVGYVVLWSLLQTFNANPLHRFARVWAQLILYYAAFTMPWWALLALYAAITGLLPSLAAALLIAIAGAYFYTTVVLPSQLRTAEQPIDLGLEAPWRVAVLANLKVGIYGGKARHLRKWAKTLNDLDVDAIMITGDWLYHPGADLVGQLMLFKSLNKPVYTVMSRSDLAYQSMSLTKQGQPLLEDTLSSTFRVLDIVDISQACVDIPAVSLCGWQEEEAIELTAQRHKNPPRLPQITPSQPEGAPLKKGADPIAIESAEVSLKQRMTRAAKPVVILAAHYDLLQSLPKAQPRPLVIAGDGPSVLSARVTADKSTQPLASRHPLLPRHQGLHQHERAQIFVAHGVGMSRWPFRVSKPTIDILHIR
ncbi:hypothetical protein PSAR109036_11020 [Psychrobacter arenosus]|uniref:hypothetical protein n=1 Tax=Psychrobacter arenosus TaxID=256326 RepID=UPI001917C828|nr:hypothetical protein [Psychrobacter arenosus]